MDYFDVYLTLLTPSYENTVLSLLAKKFLTKKKLDAKSEISYLMCLGIIITDNSHPEFYKDGKPDVNEVASFIIDSLTNEKVKIYSTIVIPSDSRLPRISDASNFNHTDFDKKVIDMVKKVSLMQG